MAKLDLSYPPMEAQLVTAIPDGDEWQFEPKWDGFRCIAHRDGDRIDLISKSGQPLGRYFPEVVATLKTLSAKRFVVDGELVVPEGKSLSFDKLLQRIHPADTPGIDKKKLTAQLEELVVEESFTMNKPGGSSRWSTTRSVEWQPINPELVIEVQFDHFTNGRFRYGTKIMRWRPDKKPSQCKFEQLGTHEGS